MRVTVNFFVSVMLGLIYVNSGDDATKMFDNYNLIFTIIMHHVTSAMMLNIISCEYLLFHEYCFRKRKKKMNKIWNQL